MLATSERKIGVMAKTIGIRINTPTTLTRKNIVNCRRRERERESG